MRLQRPQTALAGYHAPSPDESVPELVFFGDQWTGMGYGLDDHSHPVWEFYLQVAGRSLWHLPHEGARGGDPQEVGILLLQEGDFWVVAPGTPHRMLEAPAKQHFLYAAIDLEPVWARHPALRSAWGAQQPMWQVSGAASMGTPFRHLAREVTVTLSHHAIGVRLALDLLVTEATRLIEREAANTSEGRTAPHSDILREHPAVSRAREMLEHQPGRAWTLQELARLTGLSPNHFAECFARDVGVPPRQFLLQTRIERAKTLLRDSDAPITHLALELGFASGQHFAATFKRLTGQTARAWRNTTG